MKTSAVLLRIDVKTHQCIVCGTDFKPNPWTKEARRQLCSTDDFWYDKTELLADPTVARIGGEHYMIGEPNDHYKGMSGQTFTIKFYDGREVTTDNLWHQGTIPEVWRDWLFNNAEFKED